MSSSLLNQDYAPLGDHEVLVEGMSEEHGCSVSVTVGGDLIRSSTREVLVHRWTHDSGTSKIGDQKDLQNPPAQVSSTASGAAFSSVGGKYLSPIFWHPILTPVL